jgi:hypothetical protein
VILKVIALAAALTVTAASAACASNSQLPAPARSTQSLPSSEQSAATLQGAPIARSGLTRLPAGVFYILGGPNYEDMNVWEISRTGVEKELTHNPPGGPIHQVTASRAGVVVAADLYRLGRLTRPSYPDRS